MLKCSQRGYEKMREEIKYLSKIKFNRQLRKISKALSNKKIIIYGAGKMLKTAMKRYNFSSLNIVGISDKNFQKIDSANFLNLPIIAPENIEELECDCILVALKEYNEVLQILKQRYHDIKILPLFKSEIISPYKFKILKQRNFSKNVQILFYNYFKNKNFFFSDEIKALLLLKEKISFLLTGKLNIPQIEFTLTTKCSMRCKHCLNYIPTIKKNEHKFIEIDEFKAQLNNLTKAVNHIRRLILIGGEPLLVNNLEEYVEVSARNPKVDKVWIFTNGTLLFKPELLKILNKYRKKIVIYVSNYSKNENIKHKFKYEEIFNQLRTNNICYISNEELNWEYASPLPDKIQRTNSQKYFLQCDNPCVSVLEGKMYVCPRAGIYTVKNIYNPQPNDYIDLNIENNPKELKHKIIEFYYSDYFNACNYCNILEDKLKPEIIPAIQLEEDS